MRPSPMGLGEKTYDPRSRLTTNETTGIERSSLGRLADRVLAAGGAQTLRKPGADRRRPPALGDRERGGFPPAGDRSGGDPLVHDRRVHAAELASGGSMRYGRRSWPTGRWMAPTSCWCRTVDWWRSSSAPPRTCCLAVTYRSSPCPMTCSLRKRGKPGRGGAGHVGDSPGC